MHGYAGRALVVDVTDGSSTVLPLGEDVLRSTLGGVGLGTWLTDRLAPVGVDPLAAENPLSFVFSPLVGTPLTTSAKFAVVAKSPLTGLLTDALASSHFAIAGKFTGYDAIVITGRAEQPTHVFITEDDVTLVDATSEWGLSAAATEDAVRERNGRQWRVASIGPGGEAQVRYATISHDGRHAGRGGLGAVLGSKLVKSVSVSGRTRVTLADKEGVLALAKDLRRRSFGPATEKYRELGTLANLLAFNAINTLPTRNFQAATFEGAPLLSTEELASSRSVAKNSCASCSIGCEHIYAGKDGTKARVEYENVFALGPLCGVSDADDVLAASARCDDLGLDTISAGGTIAWAMECVERGLVDAPWLRFGEGAAVLRALDEIAAQTEIGLLLAQGTRRAAEQVGQGSESFAAHVKGMEMPGYEPRTLQSMALGLAVNARGADHNRSGAYEADLSGDRDRFTGAADHVRAAIATEDRAAIIDSMILCKFLRGVFADPYPEWAELLARVTGWDITGDELQETAARIVLAKRAFNLREGWTADDDWLPERFLDTPLTLQSGRSATLPASRLRDMINTYYAERGLDAQGRPQLVGTGTESTP